MEIDNETSMLSNNQKQAFNKKSNVKKVKKIELQIPEIMMSNDINLLNKEDYWFYARPDGERCLISSGFCKTIARSSQGHTLKKFESLLPAGSLASHLVETNYDQIRCKLECIYNKPLDIFFIVDCLMWDGISYINFPLCSRIL